MLNFDKEQIIAYVLYIIITSIAAFIASILKRMRQDKNSYYSKQIEFIGHQEDALKAKIGQTEYDHAKEQAKDIILLVEQLGKELAWDSVTKHSKATEMISKNTGLNDEQIFNIIKSTIALINKD